MKDQFPTKSISTSEEQTKDFAQKLAAAIKAPAIVCLSGDLGAGKTTFCKGFAAQLGIQERDLKSPTYTFIREHKLPVGKLYHCDFYRIEKADDLLAHDLHELFQRKDALILIEWPERVADLIPAGSVNVHLKYIDDHSREISID